MSQRHAHLYLAIWILCLFLPELLFAKYQIGVGRADMTGPAAEIVFMGYAKPNQQGCGIHLRQFARAFIFDDGTSRVLFVSVDIAMVSHGLRAAVLKKLQATYSETYSYENFILSGVHTHGAPGGFLMDFLYDFSQLGFCQDTFDAYVNGIFKAIRRAHESVTEARMFINSAEILDANINRSPAAYALNPEEERNKYKYNTDKTLQQLKIVRVVDNKIVGAINWYAVHPVSMNSTNCLITSDNMGYASILLEAEYNPGSLVGQGSFVGAFASTNLGDVSPNLKGQMCVNTGKPCNYETSSCDESSQYCIATGPGDDMFESTELIAERLAAKSKELLVKKTSQEITGPIKFIHQWVNMAEKTIEIHRKNGTVGTIKSCSPAMGYSFAAGTTDGPGASSFIQGTTQGKLLWNYFRDFLFGYRPEDGACHYPKPILINSGRAIFPYSWQPKIVSTQILLLGNFAVIGVPGEFTTMSGRRLRDTVKTTLISNGGDPAIEVVIAGLSNMYTSYITTYEEYQLQRYEGASTIYGPHTLRIYQAIYKNLAEYLIKGKKLDPGPPPPDLSKRTLLSLNLPIIFDKPGSSRSFGDVIQQPPDVVKIGEIVSVKFIAGHPRNDLMTEKTFLAIEKRNDAGNWTVIATDANFETKFIWTRTSTLKGTSEVEIQWQIRSNIKPGIYRIRHFGHYKDGKIYPYKGTSKSFIVTSPL